jgi:hypothetical protein
MDAGDLTVKYNIVSQKAESALNRIAVKLKKVEDYAVKSSKAVSKSMKASTKAFAAFGAIAVGVLYGIIRASSYATMYSDAFHMSLTRVADAILEMTGLDKAVEAFLDKFEGFADALSTGDIDKWVNSLTLLDKVLISLGISLAIVGSVIGGWVLLVLLAKGYMLLWAAGLKAFTVKLISLGATLLTMPLWVAAIVGAVLGMIVVWILWKTGVLKAIYDLGERFGTWVQELGAKFATWVAGLGEKFGNWVIETKEKLGTFKTWMFEKFDEIWAHIITGLTDMKADFFSIIDKIIGKIGKLITKILSIPKSIAGGGGGVYKTTSSTSRSSGFATGAHITSSGAAGVHAGEDIVRLKSLLAGIRTDQAGGNTNSNTNNITVNVSGATGSTFENRDLADTVSRKIASEMSRITPNI